MEGCDEKYLGRGRGLGGSCHAPYLVGACREVKPLWAMSDRHRAASLAGLLLFLSALIGLMQ